MEERGNYELLNIFVTDEDKKGTDLLAMSNFFNIFIGKTEKKVKSSTVWEVVEDASRFLGMIVTAIKCGFDVSNMGTLVADMSRLSKEILEGLNNGTYHIGLAKDGGYRPAILDKSGKIVKQINLKMAINPAEVLSDISSISMQASLKRISTQLEDIGRNVDAIVDFMRREKLSNPFINARDRILLAATADIQQQVIYLKEADKYLLEGLTSLYADLNAEVESLEKLNDKAFPSLSAVDEILAHINDDMLMIPRYVALRAYLFNFQEDSINAGRVLDEYRYHLENISEKKVKGRHTALELVHMYSKYEKDNIDFWLEQPKQMLSTLSSYETILEQKGKNIFYAEVEGDRGE